MISWQARLLASRDEIKAQKFRRKSASSSKLKEKLGGRRWFIILAFACPGRGQQRNI
jgi:hypothetical protein